MVTNKVVERQEYFGKIQAQLCIVMFRWCLKKEHKTKAVKRDIFLPVKELFWLTNMHQASDFGHLSLFVNINWNNTFRAVSSDSCSLAMHDIMLVLLLIGHWRLTKIYVCCIKRLIMTINTVKSKQKLVKKIVCQKY